MLQNNADRAAASAMDRGVEREAGTGSGEGGVGPGLHRRHRECHRRDGQRVQRVSHRPDAARRPQGCDEGQREHAHKAESGLGQEECDMRERQERGSTTGDINMMVRGSGNADSGGVGEPMGPVSESDTPRISNSGRDGELSDPSIVPPPPRPDRRGRGCQRRQRDPERLPTGPQRHGDASARAQSDGVSGQTRGGLNPMGEEESSWVMPWERQPSWMYLPHLLDRAEDHQRDGAEEQQPEGARSSSSGWGNVDMNRGQRPPGAEAATRGGRAGDGSAGHAIRGQLTVPGPESGTRRSGEADGAVLTMEEIRGPPTEPGAQGGGGARARAQQRLEARNAHLSISLAQHADRVRKRRQECPNAGEGPTPSERVAALRRRIEEKRMRGQAHSAALDVGGGTSSVPGMDEQSREEPTAWSNEDPHKIHFCMNLEADVTRIRMDTAGGGGGGRREMGEGQRDGALDSHARGDGRSVGAGGAAVWVETAADWAANHVAWHTSSRGSGAGA